mmetsp:Transcript_18129/g.51132  ORF Transcript_18129/g.51132 Transcript_18129/m.51132 type:complete len:205 (+) Transcript_18129:1001-1615(+)
MPFFHHPPDLLHWYGHLVALGPVVLLRRRRCPQRHVRQHLRAYHLLLRHRQAPARPRPGRRDGLPPRRHAYPAGAVHADWWPQVQGAALLPVRRGRLLRPAAAVHGCDLHPDLLLPRLRVEPGVLRGVQPGRPGVRWRDVRGHKLCGRHGQLRLLLLGPRGPGQRSRLPRRDHRAAVHVGGPHADRVLRGAFLHLEDPHPHLRH